MEVAEHRVAIAVHKFGLGASPNDFARATPDPVGWLAAQIRIDPRAPSCFAGLSDSGDTLRLLYAAREQRPGADREALREQLRDVLRAELSARAHLQASSEAPFFERWVAHWSNHLTVSATRNEVVGLVGAYEREAIRPFVLGPFRRLLGAAITHPAMLLYLDNARSTGPHSEAAQRRDQLGRNENLAREILELHTLGVHGGYDQDDVIGLADILTGWGVFSKDAAPDGRAVFDPRRHEPGGKRLLGRRYGPFDEQELYSALDDLASHPATARNVALRVARHFVCDKPNDGTLDRLAKVFSRTDGDLSAVALAVLDEPDAWKPPLSKVRRPDEWVIACARALSIQEQGDKLSGLMRDLGQTPWAAPSPAGWSDQAADWLAPDALLARVQRARDLAKRFDVGSYSALDLAESTLGSLLSSSTRATLRKAPEDERLALFLCSPEMLRR